MREEEEEPKTVKKFRKRVKRRPDAPLHLQFHKLNSSFASWKQAWKVTVPHRLGDVYEDDEEDGDEVEEWRAWRESWRICRVKKVDEDGVVCFSDEHRSQRSTGLKHEDDGMPEDEWHCKGDECSRNQTSSSSSSSSSSSVSPPPSSSSPSSSSSLSVSSSSSSSSSLSGKSLLNRFIQVNSSKGGERKHRGAFIPFVGLTGRSEQSRNCCKNGGTCILGTFCACPPSFTGRNCEYDQRIRTCGLIPHGEWVQKGCSYCRCGYGVLRCFPNVFHKDCDDSEEVRWYRSSAVNVIPTSCFLFLLLPLLHFL
ncbi:teratocarcinoma-derived growth factor 1 [Acanthochromis polyacanthus]|uniref:teratocarcinoma-derived growth factor 1 n=1 Tax=Acanthochromis polyacanthus TaxID=80966 RepID=UPI0022343485|nr:teratocarcinoma-derived growth factor 1 [Acanthochromis polyacanthus]